MYWGGVNRDNGKILYWGNILNCGRPNDLLAKIALASTATPLEKTISNDSWRSCTPHMLLKECNPKGIPTRGPQD